jgi:hypothetical protein
MKKHARSTLSPLRLPEDFFLRDKAGLEIADATLRALAARFDNRIPGWQFVNGDRSPVTRKKHARSLPEAFLLRDNSELERADAAVAGMICQLVK